MADATLQILLKAIDQSTAVLKSVEGQLLGLDSAQQKSAQSGAGLTAMAVAAGVALEQMGQKAVHVVEDVAKMTVEWESATVTLQNQADLGDTAMGTLSGAILSMAENSRFGATEIARALAAVAGRFETATGAALNGSTATTLWRESANLAEASGTNLADSMSDLVNVMLAYQLPLSGVNRLSDQLFNTSRMTGLGIGELATAADRLKDTLGNAAPDIGQMSALLVELTAQGLSGQRGLLKLSSGMATLTSDSDAVNTVLRNLGVGVYDAQGNFIGIRAVIAELAPVFATLTQQQQTEAAQTLFGAGAAGVLLNVIKDGVGAYDQYVARVNKSGEAAEAANRNWKTLADQMAVLRNHAAALAIAFGEQLAGPVGKVVAVLNPLFTWIQKNDQAATVLAILFTGVLATGIAVVTFAFGAMAVAAWTAFVSINIAFLGIPLALAAIGAALYLLVNNWDAVWGAMQAAPGFLRDHVKEILEDIALFFTPGGILGLIVRYWGTIFEHMPEPVQKAMNAVAGVVEWLVKHVLELFANVIDAIAGMLSAISDAAHSLASIPGVGPEVFGGLASTIDGVTAKLYGASAAARDLAANLNLALSIPAATAAPATYQGLLARLQWIHAVQTPAPGPGAGVPPPLPTTGGGPSQAEKDLLALALAFEAFHAATQGTIQDFQVFLKVMADRADMDTRFAEAQVNLRVAEIEAADATYGLKATFVALAEDAIKAGRTIKEELANVFTQLLSKWESQFSALINKPTRESSALQLQIDQLQLQRDLLLRGGRATDDPRVKALDSQITALQQEQKIRQDQLAILKDQNALMLAANFSDRDLALQLQLTAAAEYGAMINVQQFGAEAYAESLQIRSLGDAAGFAADQLRVIGYLSSKPAASYAAGIAYVPHDMVALVHQGERITPAHENLSLLSGRSGGSASHTVQNYFQTEIHVTADGDIGETQMRKLARIVRQEQEAALSWARSGGSQPPGGAFG